MSGDMLLGDFKDCDSLIQHKLKHVIIIIQHFRSLSSHTPLVPNSVVFYKRPRGDTVTE